MSRRGGGFTSVSPSSSKGSRSVRAMSRRAVELSPPDAPALVDRRLAAAALEFDAGDARAAEEALELLAEEAPAEDRARVLLELARVVLVLRGSPAAADIQRRARDALTPDV